MNEYENERDRREKERRGIPGTQSKRDKASEQANEREREEDRIPGRVNPPESGMADNSMDPCLLPSAMLFAIVCVFSYVRLNGGTPWKSSALVLSSAIDSPVLNIAKLTTVNGSQSEVEVGGDVRCGCTCFLTRSPSSLRPSLNPLTRSLP